MTTVEKDLSVILKEMRIAAGLTQQEVSEALGYSTPQFVSNWERGLSAPPINMLKRIAKLYNTSADDFFEAFLSVKLDEVREDLERKFSSAKK